MNASPTYAYDDVTMNVTADDVVLKHAGFNWVALVNLPLIVFGATGNILVCMAVTREKRLQSVTNYYLLSLAITDLLVCLIVWPFNILHAFLGYWPLDVIVCDLYATSDVLMCTSSILHLCCISLERYLAIRNPLSSRIRSKSVVRCKIALVWLATLAISSPIMILGFVDEKNIFANNQCVLRNNAFIIYGSVMAFYIPLGVMAYLYLSTMLLLRAQWKLCDPNRAKSGEIGIRRSKSQMTVKRNVRGRLRNFDEKTQTRRTRSCPVSQSFDSSCSEMVDNIQNTSNGSLKPLLYPKANGIHTSETIDTNHVLAESPTSPTDSQSSSEYRIDFDLLRQRSIPIDELEEDGSPRHRSTATPRSTSTDAVRNITSSDKILKTNGHLHDKRANTLPDVNENMPSKVTRTFSTPSRLQDLVRRHQGMIRSASSLLSKKDSVRQKEEKNNVRTEQKAIKTLGILFVTFIICWAPFFIVNILSAICSTCHFDQFMVTVFVWLGYVSSILNPIIYTVSNKIFRSTFIKLLKCQYRTIQRPSRIAAMCVGISGIRDHSTEYLQIPL